MRPLALLLCLALGAASLCAEERPYAPSSIPGKKWQDAQFKVVKPKGSHDLPATLAKAKAEKKYVFVQMGRQNCTNTMQLWHMLADGRVTLPKDFLYADISGDDEEMRMAFEANFSMEEDATWFPLVVIVGPDGSQLATCAGRHTPEEYNALIKKAVEDYTLYPIP